MKMLSEMKRMLQLRLLSCLLVLPLTLVNLAPFGTASASAIGEVSSYTYSERLAADCDRSSLIQAATHQYRMFYDQHYASRQTIATTTNSYRRFYDGGYIAAQRIAAATNQYCAGTR